MVLNSDNIEIIKQFADKLEKWANNLSYSTSETKNFWVELILLFYPQDLQVMVSWLANIPAIGQKIQKDFNELTRIIHKVDIWYVHGVRQEEFSEFDVLFDRLKETVCNFVFNLRRILETEKSDPPLTEAITLKKSDNSVLRETEPARKEFERVSTKIPRKEALMAYHLHYEMGMTQSQVAKRIASELKLDKPVRKWEISRWIKQVENWRINTGLPVDLVPKNSRNPVL